MFLKTDEKQPYTNFDKNTLFFQFEITHPNLHYIRHIFLVLALLTLQWEREKSQDE